MKLWKVGNQFVNFWENQSQSNHFHMKIDSDQSLMNWQTIHIIKQQWSDNISDGSIELSWSSVSNSFRSGLLKMKNLNDIFQVLFICTKIKHSYQIACKKDDGHFHWQKISGQHLDILLHSFFCSIVYETICGRVSVPGYASGLFQTG